MIYIDPDNLDLFIFIFVIGTITVIINSILQLIIGVL